jgi:hypothetical protein
MVFPLFSLLNTVSYFFHWNQPTPLPDIELGINSLCIKTPCEQNIATCTASAQQWVLENYGGDKALARYISNHKDEILFQNCCKRLLELCGKFCIHLHQPRLM